jgi:hypothetical protein
MELLSVFGGTGFSLFAFEFRCVGGTQTALAEVERKQAEPVSLSLFAA